VIFRHFSVGIWANFILFLLGGNGKGKAIDEKKEEFQLEKTFNQSPLGTEF
jgi:hypothetical protein